MTLSTSVNLIVFLTTLRYKCLIQCWEFEPANRPQFTDIVKSLSLSLEGTAGYLQLDKTSTFGGSTVESSECKGLELVEEQSHC